MVGSSTLARLLLLPVLFAACAPPEKVGTDPSPQLDGVVVSPVSVSVGTGETATFQAHGHMSDGSSTSITITWSATGGAVSAGGIYTAGGTAGSYRVIGATASGEFADTATVTVTDTPVPVTLTSVTISPPSVNLIPAGGQVFTATGHYSNGSSSPVAVTWTGTGGTISGSGGYLAGATLGTFRVIATATAAPLADTADVVIQAAPVTLTSVEVTPSLDTLLPGGTRSFSATGHYSDGSSSAVAVAWSATGGTITGGGSYTAGSTPGSFRVIGLNSAANKGDTATVIILDPVTPPPPGTILLTEDFENSNAGARGWYANTSPAISPTEHHGGSGSLQMAWQAGATNPVQGASLRHLFTSSDRVYLRLWLKYSANFVGSGKPYHPHEFEFLTDADDMWIGPSQTHLSVLFEHNWQSGNGYPRITSTDGLNIDPTKIGVDLTNVTENRATAGCNGNSDGYSTSCYEDSGEWFNGKEWVSNQAAFTTAQGAGYKNAWHKVEVYLQMNSIANGKARNDGIAQYWFDGQLKLNIQNGLFRTGANSNMKFNQFMIAPYIGDGSPVAQTFWVDELVVATGPVP